MNLLTGLFDRAGLQTNTTKTNVMMFVPGKIWSFLSDTAYRARMDEDFRMRVRVKRWIAVSVTRSWQ